MWKNVWTIHIRGTGIPGVDTLVLDNISVTPQGGMQVPGDCNQDKRVDISDGFCLLGYLFGGNPTVLPCGNGQGTHRANEELLDWNQEGGIDISDALSMLNWLFLGGRPHYLGTERQPLPDCPDLPGK